jgi:hypothetical protein
MDSIDISLLHPLNSAWEGLDRYISATPLELGMHHLRGTQRT